MLKFHQVRLELLKAIADENGWDYGLVVDQFNNNPEFHKRINIAAEHLADEAPPDLPPSFRPRGRYSDSIH
jgi:hypothetical protein